MEKNMKEIIQDYKCRLEGHIAEYMDMAVTERNAASVCAMLGYWEHICHIERDMGHKHKLSHDETEKWAEHMENADGSTGAHWTIEQTTVVAKTAGVVFDHLCKEDFWVAMNMMYSDYCGVAEKFGVNRPDFYAELAKAFLFDKDGPGAKEKLATYYHCIAGRD